MPAPSFGRHALERSPSFRDIEKRSTSGGSALGKCSLSRHLQRVYPLSIHKSPSSLTLSSLSLSQNSNDSSLNSSISSWDPRINHISFRGMFGSWGRKETEKDHHQASVGDGETESLEDGDDDRLRCIGDDGSLKRCTWITKSSDEAYVSFHDECWGVPVFNDSRLFELLALSGMLIDHNWTEILKRREQYREVFAKFDHNVVAKMDENDVTELSSNKELLLAECRVRCIVDNAKCIQKVAKEFGSFSGYIWGHVNHRPMINKHKYPRSIPLRTPKAEAISKDLVRRGFRLVGPVIVYSFMQAAGMAIDHVTGCFRFRECVRLAQRSWGMTNMAM